MVWNDLAVIGSLVLLEGLLSADNALVLAVLVRHLPKSQQKRALRYGIWGAFLFRAIALLVATWLITAWYFKVGGALYLLYVGLSHLVRHDTRHTTEATAVSHASFWKTVLVVELTDIAFSVDSILAAVAISDKLWVVYLGGLVGIIAMRLVAGLFLGLLHRFPGLATGAYLLVVWIGVKLLLGGWVMVAESLGPGWGWTAAEMTHRCWEMPESLFWLGMATLFIGSMLWPTRTGRHNSA
ncbi:MAG: TerC family protein [Deltaproteobacteria bacterium]|nr:TerC family protein [Deltaproteobacteria bacterium]